MHSSVEFCNKRSPKYNNLGKTPEQLVRDNQRLVHKEAHRLAKRGLFDATNIEEYRDVAAAGAIGLFQAAKRYDPASGNQFSSLAIPWIRGEIMHYLRANGQRLKTPRQWNDYYSKGRNLSDTEAAAINGISLDLWLQIRDAFEHTWINPISEDYDTPSPASQSEPLDLPTLAGAIARLETWMQNQTEADRELIEVIYFKGEARRDRKRQLLKVLKTLPVSDRLPTHS